MLTPTVVVPTPHRDHIAVLEYYCDDLARRRPALGHIFAALRSDITRLREISSPPTWYTPQCEVANGKTGRFAPWIQTLPGRCVHGLREACCAICKELSNPDYLVQREERGVVVGMWETFMWPPCAPDEEDKKELPHPNAKTVVLPTIEHGWGWKKQKFVTITPEDVDWANKQAPFPHTHSMPQLLRNFCTTCIRMTITDSRAVVRCEKGMYIAVDHQHAIWLYDEQSVLRKTHEFVDGAEHQAMLSAEVVAYRAGDAPPITAEVRPVTFRCSCSIEWRRKHSSMGKLLSLYAEVSEEMCSEEIPEHFDVLSYKQATRYLLACKRWITERNMIAEKHPRAPYELRSINDILLESA